MIVEHTTFRLASGVGEEEFLALDERVQQEFAPFQHGFIRRTTARGEGGFLVEQLWYDLDAAGRAERSSADDELCRSFSACIDPATLEVRRYETLD